MKKYFLIVLSIITTHAHAMEMAIEKPTAKPFQSCWFLILPMDIRNYIAQLLFYDLEETEEEFIARTKTLKIEKIPEQYFKLTPKPAYMIDFINITSKAVSCPNNTIVAIVQENTYETIPQILTVIDIKKNEILYKNTYDAFLNNIAISRDGDTFAFIHLVYDRVDDTSQTEFVRWPTVLSIKQRFSNEIRDYDIHHHFYLPKEEHPGIAFNKQGTHIILHGCDYRKELSEIPRYDAAEKVPHHMIISLQENTPYPKPGEKTLMRYFKLRKIFEKPTKHITLTT